MNEESNASLIAGWLIIGAFLFAVGAVAVVVKFW